MSKLGKVLLAIGGIDVGLALGLVSFLGGCIFTMVLVENAKESEKKEPAKKNEYERSEAEIRKDLANKLFQEGFSTDHIANILNVAEATVGNMLFNEGVSE